MEIHYMSMNFMCMFHHLQKKTMGEYLYDLRLGQTQDPNKLPTLKTKCDKFNDTKMETFCLQKYTIKQIKIQTINRERICTTCITDKVLVSLIGREFPQIRKKTEQKRQWTESGREKGKRQNRHFVLAETQVAI